MSSKLSRRDLLKIAGAGAGLAGATGLAGRARLLEMPYLMAQNADKPKLRTALIGCGGQGRGAHIPEASRENLVALVDPDQESLKKALARVSEVEKTADVSKIKTFTDYRKFFDAMGKEVDAIFIATPNHHHALPAMMALERGIAVYVEKPMAYDIMETRKLSEMSIKAKVATQMGNQGHSGEGYRRLCEYIWAGAIGNVTEVYHWCDRTNGGSGGRFPTIAVPTGLEWDSWIGPAPYREYHKDLHPHEWHNWHDFGNGSLGNMGAHVMDGAHWALKLNHPTSIEVEDMLGGSSEKYPVGTRIRWDFPAREGMVPVKVWWYDGKVANAQAAVGDTNDSVSKNAQNLPPLVRELEKKLGRKFDSNGTLYVGDKGMMYTATYGGGVRILPEELHKATPVPPVQIERIKGTHQANFLRGVRGGPAPVSNFETAAKLNELLLLGCLAIKAGVGNKLEWDGDKMRVTNRPEVNKWLGRKYRAGWGV